MRKHILIIGLLLISMKTFSQENMVTVSGGYSFANIEDTDEKGTGWRINGLYEYNPTGGIFAHGVSIGYIHLTATDGAGEQEITSKVNSFPIYYAPKVMFGPDKFKVFIKGALGMQIAHLKREVINSKYLLKVPSVCRLPILKGKGLSLLMTMILVFTEEEVPESCFSLKRIFSSMRNMN